jgi:hypothetical protein
MNRRQIAGIGMLAGALTIVGAIGPWVTSDVLRQDLSGTDANRGVTVAIAAGVALLLMALAGWKNQVWPAVLAAVAGLVSFGLTIWSFAAINKFAGLPDRFSVSRGWGIWLALIASIVLVAAAIWAALLKERAAAVELPSETTTN